MDKRFTLHIHYGYDKTFAIPFSIEYCHITKEVTFRLLNLFFKVCYRVEKWEYSEEEDNEWNRPF